MYSAQWVNAAHVIAAVSTVICIGSAVFMLLMRASFASRDEVEKLARRVLIIEQVASPEWLRKVGDRLGGVESKLEGLQSTLTGMKENQDHQRQTLDSIQQYLLVHNS